MRNTQPKIKPVKIKKQPGTYCFECKNYTQNLTVLFVGQINQDF